MVLELEGPVVLGPTPFPDDPRCPDVEGPDPQGGVHDLTPDALVVEVLDARHGVVAADDAVDEVLLLGAGGTGVDAEPRFRLGTLRQVPLELLAVDVDGLEVAAGV